MMLSSSVQHTRSAVGRLSRSAGRRISSRNSTLPPKQRGAVAVRAQEQDPDNNLESMFVQELKRRGLDSVDDLNSWPASDEGSAQQQAPGGSSSSSSSSSKSPFQSATTTTPRTRQSGGSGAGELEGQRQRSIAMVNEGLEGLIPRATELLKLGGSVFLAFAPFILAISILFGGIYLTFGDNFVHGGDRSSGPPAYVDPNLLLSEPTVDPYIPYQ